MKLLNESESLRLDRATRLTISRERVIVPHVANNFFELWYQENSATGRRQRR